MRVLILGGQGFIGYNLCLKLLDKKNDITVFDKVIDKKRMINGVNYFKGDFTDVNCYKYLLKNMDIVYHLISSSNAHTDNSFSSDISDNVISTIYLLDECVKYGVKKVIFSSSGGTIYGNQMDFPIKESSIKNPLCSYAITKLTIEYYLELYYNLYGLDYTILRVSNPYGPNHNSNNQGIINILLKSAIKDEAFILYGSLNIRRDYIYIDDVISAFVLAINSNSKEKIFNIGTGVSYSTSEIISMIETITNKKINIIYKKSNIKEVIRNELDIELAKKELNWFPEISLNSGIEKTFKLLKK